MLSILQLAMFLLLLRILQLAMFLLLLVILLWLLASVADVAAAKTADDAPSAIIYGVTAVVFGVPAVDANPAVAGVTVVVAIPAVIINTAVADNDIPTE
jgi:hypothetical protein